eukprot:365879-Chlamydomonas_euryale.AAC.3
MSSGKVQQDPRSSQRAATSGRGFALTKRHATGLLPKAAPRHEVRTTQNARRPRHRVPAAPPKKIPSNSAIDMTARQMTDSVRRNPLHHHLPAAAPLPYLQSRSRQTAQSA